MSPEAIAMLKGAVLGFSIAAPVGPVAFGLAALGGALAEGGR